MAEMKNILSSLVIRAVTAVSDIGIVDNLGIEMTSSI